MVWEPLFMISAAAVSAAQGGSEEFRVAGNRWPDRERGPFGLSPAVVRTLEALETALLAARTR
jgi:hypothetical protein